jgi:hypothetical protein
LSLLSALRQDPRPLRRQPPIDVRAPHAPLLVVLVERLGPRTPDHGDLRPVEQVGLQNMVGVAQDEGGMGSNARKWGPATAQAGTTMVPAGGQTGMVWKYGERRMSSVGRAATMEAMVGPVGIRRSVNDGCAISDAIQRVVIVQRIVFMASFWRRLRFEALGTRFMEISGPIPVRAGRVFGLDNLFALRCSGC